MPLETTNIFVPAASGLNDDVSPLTKPIGIHDVLNGFWDKEGRIVKRAGFTKLALTAMSGNDMNHATNGTPRGMFSTGEELCVVGGRSLWAWNPTDTYWINRGPISPFTAELETVFHDSYSYPACDSVNVASYTLQVATRVRSQGTTNAYAYSVVYRYETDDGGEVYVPLSTVVAEAGIGANTPYGPLVCQAGTGSAARIGVLTGNSSPVNLTVYSLGGPTGTPTSVVSYADVSYIGIGVRVYDMCECDDDYVVARVKYIGVGNATVVVELLDRVTHAVNATRTIGTTELYYLVSVCHDTTNNLIHVATYQYNTGAGSDIIELTSLNDSDLTVTYGPTTIETIASGGVVDSLGVAVGSDGTTTRVCINWAQESGAGTHSELVFRAWITGIASIEYDHTDADTVHRIYNTAPRTRPFWQGTRCYFAGFTTSGAGHGYDSGCIIDTCQNEGGASRFHYLVGCYDVGIAPTGGTVADNALSIEMGTLNHAYSAGTNKVAFSSVSTSLAFDDDRSGAKDTEVSRNSGDRVVLDFAGLPLATRIMNGAAVVGGGLTSWYDGALVSEMGYLTCPVIEDTDDLGVVSPGLADDTYSYVAVWETFDSRGTLHRSFPSPSAAINVAVAASGVGIDATRSLGATNRLAQSIASNCVYYRADVLTDTQFRRCQVPVRVNLNIGSARTIAEYRDLGEIQPDDTAPILYTQGGAQIESVAPEGAKICAVVGERLWLGGFYRRDRIQYSKSFVPYTAAEDAIAPEFNEGFSATLPDGRRCTGLAELDDKLVVFTESEIWLMAGRGPNDAGQGSDFSGLQLLSNDAGCVEPRSIVGFPGGVMFQSKAGIYQIDRSGQVSFVGRPVRDQTDSRTVTSACLVPKATHVRFTIANSPTNSTGQILCYDYRLGLWSRWQLTDSVTAITVPIGSCVHKDVYYVLESDGTVWKEDSTTSYDDVTRFPSIGIWTSWLQAAQPNGFQRLREIVPLMDHRDYADVNVKVYKEFNTATAAQTFTVDGDTVKASYPAAGAYLIRPRLKLSNQKGQAFQVYIYDSACTATTTARGFRFHGLTFRVGAKRGTMKPTSVEMV